MKIVIFPNGNEDNECKEIRAMWNSMSRVLIDFLQTNFRPIRGQSSNTNSQVSF